MKALLIIDMQKGSFEPYAPAFDTSGIIKRVNILSASFRTKKLPVIFIQHDGSSQNSFLPGTDEWEILPAMLRMPEDIVVEKKSTNSFYKTSLRSTLDKLAITELFVTGSATDFCVDTTVKAAMSNDYQVTVVSDGHTTNDRPFADAKTIIAHYNWVWSELSPTKYHLKLLSTEEAKKLIEQL